MRVLFLQRFFTLVAISSCVSLSLQAAPWLALGPYGGDARTIAADPHDSGHLYLGTATGFLYESVDAGKTWRRLSRVGKRDDLVISHIVVDSQNSKHLLVSTWLLDRPDGGIFESHDDGVTWEDVADMKGQSVRSLTVAGSDAKMLVAGTLNGVFRSSDGGAHWKLISPSGSAEIHEIESVAIDPTNPMIIYAGTWHLPWKTVDGGSNWTSMKDGILDDSDVFSIIVDPHAPQIVYASACSGIYKSVNAGTKFERTRKDQLGMDHAALRTRKLQQDPVRSQIVFAGTTQGLWRTTNSGAAWSRLTAPDVIVNDVFVDPDKPDHVLIATDRGGVLSSEDDGVTFQPSNEGFSARQVTSVASEMSHPAVVYAGVVNDKDAGGVFVSQDGGVRWQQQSIGLAGRDVFSLAVTAQGTVLAGTSHGIYRLGSSNWIGSGLLAPTTAPAPDVVAKPVSKTHTTGAKGTVVKGKVIQKTIPTLPPAIMLDAVVYSLASSGEIVYAGTSQGLLVGSDNGSLWTPVVSTEMPEPRYVSAQGTTVLAADLGRLSVSVDAGKTWTSISPPQSITQLAAIAVDATGTLWVGGREGLYYSADAGKSWKTLQNLYLTNVTGVTFDAAGQNLLVTSQNSTLTFVAHLPDHKVSHIDSGWNLRFVRQVGDHMVGATAFDGIVVQPVMVESKAAE